MLRESKSPHSTAKFCVKKPNGKWYTVGAYNKLNAVSKRAQTPFIERIFFRTTWKDVQCTLHLNMSMVIINCSCEQVISCLQRLVLQSVCFGSSWLGPRGFLMSRLRLIVWWWNCSVLTVHMHKKHNLMTFLSIVERKMIGRTWITTSTIYELFSSARALILLCIKMYLWCV